MRAMKNSPAPTGRDRKGVALAEHPPGKRLRGLLALGLCLCLALGLPGAPALAAEAPTTKWSETANYDTSWYNATDTEFTLTTAKQLAGLAVLVNGGNSFSGKTVKLGAGIDLAAHLWEPIGRDFSKKFNGAFDGCGKTVSGVIISGAFEYAGLFGNVDTGGSIHGLQIKNASIESAAGNCVYAGILVGRNAGAIYDCAVAGSINVSVPSGSAYSTDNGAYVGGLVGDGSTNGNTIKNCSAQLSTVTVNTAVDSMKCRVGGIAASIYGQANAENCFASVAVATITANNFTPVEYNLSDKASYSYWDSAGKLTDSNTAGYTECYAVTAEQIAGTGGGAIGSGSYANTASLAAALNGWVAAQSGGTGYSAWALKNGAPLPAIFIPEYLDLNEIPEQSKSSSVGEVDASVDLRGQFQENVRLISVTLPATIPFILDVDGAGELTRVLSATAALTNRSDMGVTVSLTGVTDPGGLLGKVKLYLTPDPLPAGGRVELSAGTGKTNTLAVMAPLAGSTPGRAAVKVEGEGLPGVTNAGSDGNIFTVGLTLKVSKT